MSFYKRGIVDGVVHYCDKGWWTAKNGKSGSGLLLPWCMLNQKQNITPATTTPTQRAAVTCLQCLWLRRLRP